jgi:hypothetical protein
MAVKETEAGDPSFMNNVPDPILSRKELPNFKYELEKSEGKVIGNSFGKTCRNGSPATRPTSSPPILASRLLCSRSSRERTCSSRRKADAEGSG